MLRFSLILLPFINFEIKTSSSTSQGSFDQLDASSGYAQFGAYVWSENHFLNPTRIEPNRLWF
jgi:hypothetical protein